jgi:hypothetical protein
MLIHEEQSNDTQLVFDAEWVTRIIRPVFLTWTHIKTKLFLTRTQIQTDMLHKFWNQVSSPVWLQENLGIFFKTEQQHTQPRIKCTV